ncbi:sulfur carrier protein ThiS [Acetobacter sp. AN02]|uniref:sulfur carrier protein ThiS n=1 Tax=Acetobacter sp. AN02 TaxID=2894186 RepID=UPI00243416E1|nr:sulfur carrier protein ThiS [Acetobacter sp. AN02]MDG6093686.1 sulfur carrier protein ThiS [Acetobacter sp. AN02]
MKITVNGDECEISSYTLSGLLEELGYTTGRIATAVDGLFVPAGLRGDQCLGEGMRVEILSPMQGG